MSGSPMGTTACEQDHSRAASFPWVLCFPRHSKGTLVPAPASTAVGLWVVSPSLVGYCHCGGLVRKPWVQVS